MSNASLDGSIESDTRAVTRLALALVVLGHTFVFLHVFILPWAPAVLVVVCYPLLVDRFGHATGTVECKNCGSETRPGSLACRDCRTWLGSDGARRSLVRGGLAAPALAIAFEVVLALSAAGLYSTSLREPAAAAFALAYPQSSLFYAFSAGLVYVAAAGSYLVVRGLTGTLLADRSMPSLR